MVSDENNNYDIEIVFNQPVGGVEFHGCESYEVGSEWIVIRREGTEAHYKVSGVVSVFVRDLKESE